MRTALLSIFFVLLLVPLARGQLLDVTVVPEVQTAHPGESISFGVILENHEAIERQYVVSLSGTELEWREPNTLLVKLQPLETKTVEQRFYVLPTAQEGTYPFALHVKSFPDGLAAVVTSLTITVLPRFTLLTLDASVEANDVKATLEVDAGKDMTADVTFEILQGDRVVTSLVSAETVTGPGMFLIHKTLPLSPYEAPGTYTLRASAAGVVIEMPFTVGERRNLVKTVDKVPTVWNSETIITVTNEGNVEETFQTQEATPSSYPLTGLLTAPTDCSTNGGETRCAYSVDVPPGQTRQIRYRVEFWPDYLKILTGGLVVLALGVFTVTKYSKPVIRKRYRRGKDMTSVVLSVRNAFNHTQGVVVRDWVSPLASVVMEEFEAVRPVVRRSDAGTELVWNLGDLKPREERLISYKIQPLIKGNLRMPPATLRYKRSSGDMVRRRSNHLTIE
ncbi:MAG: hypothetical protein HY369_05605 [Candidatus Aenigmarchaeota archaeon]|nr:hypothetical protein [Candidatus Aenigmarchaeota archaeon]